MEQMFLTVILQEGHFCNKSYHYNLCKQMSCFIWIVIHMFCFVLQSTLYTMTLLNFFMFKTFWKIWNGSVKQTKSGLLYFSYSSSNVLASQMQGTMTLTVFLFAIIFTIGSGPKCLINVPNIVVPLSIWAGLHFQRLLLKFLNSIE